MWKSVDEITAYNQSAGRSTTHDPFEAANTMVVTVEGITLEGDHVVLSTCCESARLARGDVLAWRDAQTTDHGTVVEVRLRRGAPVLAQRAAIVDDNPPCPRCGRSWDGLPPVHGDGGRDEGPPRDTCRARDPFSPHEGHGHHDDHRHADGPDRGGPHDHHGPRDRRD